MSDHPHSHDEPGHEHASETPVDAGSQALAEALRSSFTVVKFVMAGLILVFLVSGYFKVESNERAIILRFGKPVGDGEKALLLPGLHWAFPYPIDEVNKVSVTGIQRVNSTVGWYATTPEQELAGTEPPGNPTLNPTVDGYTLSADTNIIHVRATLTYQIEDPLKYIFHFVNASNVVQDALNNAIVYASANFKVDDLLTHDKAGFKEAIRRRVADLLDKDDVGVNVNDCTVDAIPPRWQKVKDAFDAVLNAQIYRDKLLQDASTYTNKILTAAVASSNSIVDLAEAERLRLVNDLASRATNFSEILPLYQSNADLFVQQRLNGVMGVALTNVKETWFLPDSSGGNRIDLWLQLNRALPKPSTGTTNQ